MKFRREIARRHNFGGMPVEKVQRIRNPFGNPKGDRANSLHEVVTSGSYSSPRDIFRRIRKSKSMESHIYSGVLSRENFPRGSKTPSDFADAEVPKFLKELSKRETRLFSGNNLKRVIETAKFVRSGDSVLEIGGGDGSVALAVCAIAKPRRYVITDLKQGYGANGYIPRLLKENSELLGDCELSAAQFNIFDDSTALITEVEPSIVLLLEVLEHLDDPEAAFSALVDQLPRGSRLLFSVPMLGRLEGVRGHLAVFSAGRIRRMIETSGQEVTALQPVADVWALCEVEIGSHKQTRSSQVEREFRAHETSQNFGLQSLTLGFKEVAFQDPDLLLAPFSNWRAEEISSRDNYLPGNLRENQPRAISLGPLRSKGQITVAALNPTGIRINFQKTTDHGRVVVQFVTAEGAPVLTATRDLKTVPSDKWVSLVCSASVSRGRWDVEQTAMASDVLAVRVSFVSRIRSQRVVVRHVAIGTGHLHPHDWPKIWCGLS